MNIPFSPPDIGETEINEVTEALRSGWITTGARTKEFEKRIASYIDAAKCVCLSSATAAMEMTLRILGVGPGDQVITTAYTYTATASVIDHVGAEIVLVDTKPSSFEMDYDLLDQAITEKTKVIMPVDIGGRPVDYDRIHEIVKAKKKIFRAKGDLQDRFGRIVILSDSAHGFGAEYKGKKSGQLADFTCFSFHAVKNLTTAEGGAVVWPKSIDMEDEELYKLFMLYSLHGQSKDALAKTRPGLWEYDILFPAYKCNMTDIQAAIGLMQLNRYQEIINRRKEIIDVYDKMAAEINLDVLMHFSKDRKSSGHLYLLRVPGINEGGRNEIIERMGEVGISTNVHYKPLPMLTAYKDKGFDIKNFPCAYRQYENEISLPLHTKLDDIQVEYVGSQLTKILKEGRYI